MEIHADAPPLPAAPSSPRLPAHGFKFLEVLWTVAILAALCVIGFPSLRFFREAAAITEIRDDVAATILSARWLALVSGEPTMVDLATSDREVVVRRDGKPLRSLDLADRSVTQSASPSSFRFDSRGIVAEGTEVTITLTNASGMSRAITVSPLGKVTRD